MGGAPSSTAARLRAAARVAADLESRPDVTAVEPHAEGLLVKVHAVEDGDPAAVDAPENLVVDGDPRPAWCGRCGEEASSANGVRIHNGHCHDGAARVLASEPDDEHLVGDAPVCERCGGTPAEHDAAGRCIGADDFGVPVDEDGELDAGTRADDDRDEAEAGTREEDGKDGSDDAGIADAAATDERETFWCDPGDHEVPGEPVATEPMDGGEYVLEACPRHDDDLSDLAARLSSMDVAGDGDGDGDGGDAGGAVRDGDDEDTNEADVDGHDTADGQDTGSSGTSGVELPNGITEADVREAVEEHDTIASVRDALGIEESTERSMGRTRSILCGLGLYGEVDERRSPMGVGRA